MKLLASLRGRWPEPGETAELLEPYGEWQGLASVYPPAGLQARARARREHGSGTARALVGDGAPPEAVVDSCAWSTRARSRSSAPGEIGESLISGLLSSGWREPSDIVATTRRAERVAELASATASTATLSNHDAVAGAALVVIAVKPQDIEGLLGEIGHVDLPEQTVLSVAAAIPTARIEQASRGRRPGRARDAQHAVDRARGDRRPLRRRARRRRAPRPRRGGARAPRRRRSGAGAARWTRSPRSRAPAPRTSRSSPRR